MDEHDITINLRGLNTIAFSDDKALVHVGGGTLNGELVDAAHENGLKVIGHALSLEDTLILLRSGIDGTAHTFFDQAPTDELVQAYKATNAWCCPTLTVAASLTGDAAAETKDFAHHPHVGRRLPENSRETMCKCISMKGPGCSLEHAYESVKALKTAGIDIVW